jgi:hypothetical protein
MCSMHLLGTTLAVEDWSIDRTDQGRPFIEMSVYIRFSSSAREAHPKGVNHDDCP